MNQTGWFSYQGQLEKKVERLEKEIRDLEYKLRVQKVVNQKLLDKINDLFREEGLEEVLDRIKMSPV